MKIEVIRDIFTEKETLGKMFIDGEFFCYTLEDAIRPQKIKHKTAIQKGCYEVVYVPSPKYGRLMPKLLDVPNFEGILIHGGNTNRDTSGCILVAFKRNEEKGYIWSSASDAINKKIAKATDKVFIEIVENKTGYNDDSKN